MGAVCSCFSDKVDFEGEVDLYHFDLHRAVGKGAFGKVSCIGICGDGPSCIGTVAILLRR